MTSRNCSERGGGFVLLTNHRELNLLIRNKDQGKL